jgi:hypothetical protein
MIATHPTCAFLQLVSDMHISGPTSNVFLVFLRLQEKFGALSLLVQPKKCATWFPQGLDPSILFPPSFLTLESNLHILGAPMGSLPFVESFVLEAL